MLSQQRKLRLHHILPFITIIMISQCTFILSGIKLVAAFSYHARIIKVRNVIGKEHRIVLSKRKHNSDAATIGYVPDGLTPEQYAKIKKQESDKKKKMDYGAWGPRFAKTTRPDGDWMVVPSLWTTGFDSNRSISVGFFNNDKSNSDQKSENNFFRMRQFTRRVFKDYIPLYVYSFVLIELVTTTLFNVMRSQITVSLLAIMYHQIKGDVSSFLPKVESMMIIKSSIIKMLLAGCLVKPLAMIIEKCNRRLLWSPRRTMTYGGLASASMLFVSFFAKIFFKLSFGRG